MQADDFDFEELEKILSRYSSSVEELLASMDENKGFIKARDFKAYEWEDKERWYCLIRELNKLGVTGGGIGDMGGRWMWDMTKIRFTGSSTVHKKKTWINPKLKRL